MNGARWRSRSAPRLRSRLATLVVAPGLWREWIDSLVSNLNEPQWFSVPPPAPIRLPIAALVVIWGARTDRPWTVAVAATLGLPIIWPHGLCVLAAAIPFLRRGDRAALQSNWRDAVQLRTGSRCTSPLSWVPRLVFALLFTGPIATLMDWASAGLNPYSFRP